MNFFVLYDADSASKKKKPRVKGADSFAQLQSVKHRKAEGLRRLQRSSLTRSVELPQSCSGCHSVSAPFSQSNDLGRQDFCPRCERLMQETLTRSNNMLGDTLISRAKSMDPFQSGAVKNDRIMDWVQQYYLLDIWPGIWPYAASRTRSLPIYDWIVPQFQENATTAHVRLFVGISIMSVDQEYAKLQLDPTRIANQKSKALMRLRKDISDVTRVVDGALILNVAVLCHVAVFTNTVEDVKPHFVGLSKLLEIHGFAGIPVMLIETQIYKVYLVTEETFPEHVEFPPAPSLPESRLPKLLARAIAEVPHLRKVGSVFLEPETRTQVSPAVCELIQKYRPLFVCREYFNLISSSDLSIEETEWISVQLCYLLRKVRKHAVTLSIGRTATTSHRSTFSTFPTQIHASISSPNTIMLEHSTSNLTLAGGSDHTRSDEDRLTSLDTVLCLALILFYICTTPAPRMIMLGIHWRHCKVLQLKSALETYLKISPAAGKTRLMHTEPFPNNSLLSIFFLGAFLCKGLPEDLFDFFSLRIRMTILQSENENGPYVEAMQWHGPNGIHEALQKGLFSDRVFAKQYQEILEYILKSDAKRGTLIIP